MDSTPQASSGHEDAGLIDPSHVWVADDFNHPSLPHQGTSPHEDAAPVPPSEPFEQWAEAPYLSQRARMAMFRPVNSP